jgi:hypothetical protein
MNGSVRITFEFHPANSPPDADTTVLLFDGTEFFCGWFDDGEHPHWDDGEHPYWYDMTAMPMDGVVAWAHMPDADLFAKEWKGATK